MQRQINGSRNKAKQDWAIGNNVKVGFLTLTVKEFTSEGIYKLTSLDQKKHYEFLPHHGLNRII